MSEEESTATSEADQQAIYHIFALLENLVNLRPDVSAKLAAHTGFLRKVLRLINGASAGARRGARFDANKAYGAEVLAILAQSQAQAADAGVEPPSAEEAERSGRGRGARTNVHRMREACGAELIDGLLQALSTFRKRDPVDADEEELMENLFDALCALLLGDSQEQSAGGQEAKENGHHGAASKQKGKAGENREQQPSLRSLFLEAEGVELMVIITQRQKSVARLKAFKVLDHALSSGASGAGREAGKAACKHFVECLGLKSLFKMLMDKVSGQRIQFNCHGSRKVSEC